jgi:hypothetical protein
VIHSKGKEAEIECIYNPDWFVQSPLVICKRIRTLIRGSFVQELLETKSRRKKPASH